MQKSSEILLASAVAQFHIESIRAIDFPPVYSDRQSDFPKKISDDSAFDTDTSYMVNSFDPSFKVYMACVWYKNDGSEAGSDEIDKVVLRKVKIEVKRSKDDYPLIKMPVFITRNGIY